MRDTSLPTETIVETHLFRRYWWLTLGAVVGIAWGLLNGAVFKFSLQTNATLILLASVVYLPLVWGSLYLLGLRAIRVDAIGVTWVAGRTSLLTHWGEILPPEYPYMMGIWIGCAKGVNGRPDKGFNVTREQARAILTHSSCPKFKLKREIWESIGLKAPPHVA